jgi:hypothetical protein
MDIIFFLFTQNVKKVVSSQKSGVWGVLSWLRQLKTPHLPLFIEMLQKVVLWGSAL